MIRLLGKKEIATKFQILVEIAANQPYIMQKEIGRKLGITPQAVSECLKELVKEGHVATDGKGRYRITKEGVNWVLEILRELKEYTSYVDEKIKGKLIFPAMAGKEIKEGEEVGLEMRGGILVAVEPKEGGAKGIALADGKEGEEVPITGIEGIIRFEQGEIRILKVPNVQKGGSKRADLAILEREARRIKLKGAMGIEALSCFRKIRVEPQYIYGVADAAIEASRHGLPFLLVCSEDEMPSLLKKLEEAQVPYTIKDITLKAGVAER